MWSPENSNNNNELLKTKMGISIICHTALNNILKQSVPLDGVSSICSHCRVPDLFALSNKLQVIANVSLSDFLKDKYGQEAQEIMEYWLDLV